MSLDGERRSYREFAVTKTLHGIVHMLSVAGSVPEPAASTQRFRSFRRMSSKRAPSLGGQHDGMPLPDDFSQVDRADTAGAPPVAVRKATG
jgi:hypothetical protein